MWEFKFEFGKEMEDRGVGMFEGLEFPTIEDECLSSSSSVLSGLEIQLQTPACVDLSQSLTVKRARGEY